MKLQIGVLTAVIFAAGPSLAAEGIDPPSDINSQWSPQSRGAGGRYKRPEVRSLRQSSIGLGLFPRPRLGAAPKESPPNEIDGEVPPLEIEETLSKRDTKSFDQKQQQLLMSAVANGDEAEVKRLLDSGNVDPGLPDYKGVTLLFHAIMGNRPSIVKLLLQTGQAKPNLRDSSGWIPLTYATLMGRTTIVELLLQDEEIDANLQDSSHWTALHEAASLGNQEITRVLLHSHKVEVDVEDSNKETPLWWAVKNSRVSVVRLLMKTGKADPNHKNDLGISPLMEAKEQDYQEILELLEGHSDKPKSFEGLSVKGNIRGLREAIEKRPLQGEIWE